MMLPIHAVLPSNASPLREDNVAHQSPRILRERSINPGHNHEYVTTGDEWPKYPRLPFVENPWTGIHHHHHHDHHQQQQLLLRHHPHAQLPYSPLSPQLQPWQDDALVPQDVHQHGNQNLPGGQNRRNIEIAKQLIKRVRASEAYVKYREPSAGKGTADAKKAGKWPDNLEEAFFEALVMYPPMGRQKLWHEDKLKGRNELVAHHIKELTGESRKRKQVSSHIQVLKAFLAHDPVVMKYLSAPVDEKDDNGGRKHASMYTSGRRTSNYPVNAASHAIPNLTSLTPSSSVAETVQRLKGDLSLFEPSGFEMFVQQKFPHSEETKRLHTYCKSIDHPLGVDLHIDGWQTLNQDFPFLAAMHETTPLDCAVLVGDASLAYIGSFFKDENGNGLPGVELGISFACVSKNLPLAAKVKCQSRFFREGQLEHSCVSDADFKTSKDDHGLETPIKFGSHFWAKTFAQLAFKMKPNVEGVDDSEEDVSTFIKGITAVQEFYSFADPYKPSPAERILVMLWSFRLSTATTGRASWQKLVLPPNLLSWQNPIPSASQYPEPPPTDGPIYIHGLSAQEMHDTTRPWQTQSTYPSLQPPFDYDSSSAGSGLSSATWPASIGDIHGSSVPSSSHPPLAGDNNFDFNNGSINISYDMADLTANFDRAAFKFEVSNSEFGHDPALDQYHHQTWHDGYPPHGYHMRQMLDSTEGGYEHAATHMGDASHSQSQSQSQETQPSFSACGSDFYSHSFDSSQQFNEHDEHPTYGGSAQQGLAGLEANPSMGHASASTSGVPEDMIMKVDSD